MDVEKEGAKSLAEMWEDNRYVRNRLRESGRLVQWPKPELTGKPTMAGIALNVHALTILASWWCPTQKKAKSPTVQELRKEALVSQNMYNTNNTKPLTSSDVESNKKGYVFTKQICVHHPPILT